MEFTWRNFELSIIQTHGLGIEFRLGGGGIFRTRPDRPWGPLSLLYSGYRVSFPGVKRPRRGVNHPPPSSAEVKERVELYLYSPSGHSWPVFYYTNKYYLYGCLKNSCMGYKYVIKVLKLRRTLWRRSQTCYFNAMNSVHFCSITLRSNQMHYFHNLKLKTIYTISLWYTTNCL
jgi:hypothetical protein